MVTSKPSWYESISLQLAVAIILTVIGAMKNDLRWLLWVAWLLTWPTLWKASKKISLQRPTMVACFILGIVVVAVFIYKINVLLEPTIEPILQPTQQINKPKAMSNEQLCTESRIFAQRMRDFENERNRQHDEAVDRLRMTESKTKEEKIRSGKQSVEFTMQWLNQYNSDFTDKLLPQARFLRAEMLSRLPPQPKNNLELDTLLFGSLAGVRPIQRTADQLETWAKKLCPSP